ncbi:MAG: multidrug efflux SMR transporter [Chloroflexota bacterium]|jgi:small multidrug resistance pump
MTVQSAIFLLVAIVAEVAATTALRFSEGFSRLVPSAVVVAGYGASFYFLAQGLKLGLHLGIAYAIWAGLGTVLIAGVGVLLFQEQLTPGVMIGIALVIVGVALINLFSYEH